MESEITLYRRRLLPLLLLSYFEGLFSYLDYEFENLDGELLNLLTELLNLDGELENFEGESPNGRSDSFVSTILRSAKANMGTVTSKANNTINIVNFFIYNLHLFIMANDEVRSRQPNYLSCPNDLFGGT